MLSLRALCASLLAFALAPSVAAQTPPVTEKHVVREGFRFPADRAPRVLLFRPEIRVGEQTTAGLFQPNAEWNESARAALSDALQKAAVQRGIDLVIMAEPQAEQAALYSEYRALFRSVVSAAVRHKMFGQDPLPTKADRFDWSLGAGLAQFSPDARPEYGLFLFSHDGFESPGRKAAQLVASLMGAKDPPGSHLGYAALVDLATGDFLWLNVDLKATGDVRTPEGAVARMEQLLAGLPVRAGEEVRP